MFLSGLVFLEFFLVLTRGKRPIDAVSMHDGSSRVGSRGIMRLMSNGIMRFMSNGAS